MCNASVVAERITYTIDNICLDKEVQDHNFICATDMLQLGNFAERAVFMWLMRKDDPQMYIFIPMETVIESKKTISSPSGFH